jgi:hypothetical protein
MSDRLSEAVANRQRQFADALSTALVLFGGVIFLSSVAGCWAFSDGGGDVVIVILGGGVTIGLLLLTASAALSTLLRIEHYSSQRSNQPTPPH